MPAASVWLPGSTPQVAHSSGCAAKPRVTWTRNIVEPYMSIRSPGRRTPTLNASAHASIVPAQTGVPAGRPVSAAAAAVTCPAISAGHARRGAGQVPGDLLIPGAEPRSRVNVVERVALARGVVVKDVLAGELPHDVGVRVEPARGARPGVGLVAPRPQQLGADRLGRQGGPAAGDDRFLAVAVGELVDLGGRPHVDAVEDRRPDGLVAGVAQDQAGADARDADAGDPASRPARPASSLAMETTSCHQTPTGSTSAQFGLGIDMDPGRDRTAVARTVPSGAASTPLLLPVPRSIPMTHFFCHAALPMFLGSLTRQELDGRGGQGRPGRPGPGPHETGARDRSRRAARHVIRSVGLRGTGGRGNATLSVRAGAGRGHDEHGARVPRHQLDHRRNFAYTRHMLSSNRFLMVASPGTCGARA